MAFRALLSSKSPETCTAMEAACKHAGIQLEICSDIFSAIEKGKKQAFSCVIVDWADQPEASFLLKRARESTVNRESVAIAVVDHEPRPAELQEHRLDFLIYRPTSVPEAEAVLAKAGEKMQPLSEEDVAGSPTEDNEANNEGITFSPRADPPEPHQRREQSSFLEESVAQPHEYVDGDFASGASEEEPRERSHALGFREVCLVVLMLAAAFCLWRARDVIQYLSQTPEGKFQVLRQSVAALFNVNQTGAAPVNSVGSDAQQDAYFNRGASSSNGQTPALRVVAPEATLPESRLHLAKAPDFPLPVPVLVHQEVRPVHVARAPIPDSMKNSSPIERPVVVTVNPAQMMPVSAPLSQPSVQSSNEPIALSEDAARALLVHTVNPVYPPEALAQKLHGAVVLQVGVGRDGAVENVKLVRGYFVLGRAALAAVKQWRFQPYNVNGHPAATQTVITINFAYPPG
jgi:TonB family protein